MRRSIGFEVHNNFTRIRQVADDLSDKNRQLPNQRRDRDNVVLAGELRFFSQRLIRY